MFLHIKDAIAFTNENIHFFNVFVKKKSRLRTIRFWDFWALNDLKEKSSRVNMNFFHIKEDFYMMFAKDYFPLSP